VVRSVVLIGMPGAGKSVVGRAVAARLGWPFVDTDDLVVQQAGRPVTRIFQEQGEGAFRRLERLAVRRAAAAHPAVIGTGGGVVLDEGNLEVLRQRGLLIWLQAPPEVLLSRLGPAAADRPLLAADPPGRLEALLRARAARYAEADITLDGTRPVDEVAEEIVGLVLQRAAATVPVSLPGGGYPVRIGAGLLDLLGAEVRRVAPSRVVLLTHGRLWRRFGARAARALAAVGLPPLRVTVPEGERAKSLRAAAAVIDRMAAAEVDRRAALVALGGGVVGDLGGFVAGVYMRGIALVHVPTTLLAQVDSAIGGKAAVNHPRAKNLVGVIHQPAVVVADVETLRPLPERELRSGLAEVVKYGMACDAALADWVEASLPAVLARETPVLADLVARCAAVKARVVAADEREAGPRRVLNYGHTVGHALERLDGRLTHGEAVALGMCVEAEVSRRLGLLAGAAVERQAALLARAGLPTRLPADAPDAAALLATMRLDKKTAAGALRLVLLKEIGQAVIDQVVPEALVREALGACRASS
jgi:3-dehydroquinate synthase